jgi:phage-related tail protein
MNNYEILEIPKGSVENLKKDGVSIANELGAAVESAISIIGVGIGEALGAALSGSADFTNIFAGIFNSLGGVISTLGEQIIKIGVAALLAKKAIAEAIVNPFAAIAAGVALTALGALIRSTTTSQNRFAVGTRNAPGGLALVGERGPELINLPRGSQVIPAAQTANMMGGITGGLEIYGILRGQDIYFSNKKYSATYARTT